MKKSELKARIKELETENILLRSLVMQPVYIYLYHQLPYNPWWEYQPYRISQPNWFVDYSHPICIDYPLGSSTLIAGDITSERVADGWEVTMGATVK